MTLVAVVKLLTFLESVVLAIFALRDDSSARVNRAFARYILFVAAASFVEFMIVTSGAPETLRFWKHFDSWMFFAAAALFHFSLTVASSRLLSRPWFVWALYGAMGAIAVIEGFVLQPFGIGVDTDVLRISSPQIQFVVHVFLVAFGCLLSMGSLVVFWRCRRRAVDDRTRKQSEIFFWSTLAIVVSGTSAEMIASVGLMGALPLAATSTTMYFLLNPIMMIGVVRYGLLRPSALSTISTVMEMLTDMVLITDMHGTIQYRNKSAARFLGQAQPVTPGDPAPPLQLRRFEGAPAQISAAELGNDGAGVSDYECLLISDGRPELPVSLSSSVLHTPARGEAGLVIILHDISARRRMEELRDSAERIMRHDLRNTLTGIVGIGGILADDPSLSKQHRDDVAIMYQSALLLSEQIEMYLYLRSIEDGAFTAQLDQLDLLAVLGAVVENQKATAQRMGVTITFMVDARAPEAHDQLPVAAIRAMLFGIFGNILKNALEASPFGATVSIEVSTVSRISVAVHNPGAIPPEIRPRFFTKYATAGKRHGIGLGAYAAKLMAEALGCSVFYSSGDSEGTTITVVFPASRASIS